MQIENCYSTCGVDDPNGIIVLPVSVESAGNPKLVFSVLEFWRVRTFGRHWKTIFSVVIVSFGSFIFSSVEYQDYLDNNFVTCLLFVFFLSFVLVALIMIKCETDMNF